jgi:hypothetical protein
VVGAVLSINKIREKKCGKSGVFSTSPQSLYTEVRLDAVRALVTNKVSYNIIHGVNDIRKYLKRRVRTPASYAEHMTGLAL